MRYTEIAIAKPFEGAPRINLAARIGATVGKPMMIRIAATGARPMSFEVLGLPKGLELRGCVISGTVEKLGEYELTVRAVNGEGKCETRITLEIGERCLLLTPLMGFTSWNAFGHYVTQEKMEHTAELIVKLGLAEYGYCYVNTDSGWQGEYGGKHDAIMPNASFPDMKGMCDRIHSLGLHAGIYANPMLHAYGYPQDFKPMPPGCTQGEPDPRWNDEKGGIGLIRKERNNALQWAEWGFDYLKYDWNPSDPYNAEMMRRELIATDRDFGFCISLKALPEYHSYWSKYCTSYRCNPDSIRTWSSLMGIYNSYFTYMDYVCRGHFFDLDMLDTGRCEMFDIYNFEDLPDYGFTEDEQLIAYTIRAFFSSPIQLSCNLDFITEFELSMYCNDEIIAINQDCGFHTARPCMMIERGESKIHVFKKKLADDSVAYAVFNLGTTIENVTVFLDDLSDIRDVWAKRDLDPASSISLKMPMHTVRVFKTTAK